jgi:hypothetical protein
MKLRNNMEAWTPAEHAIYNATQVVESTGAHPFLTQAVDYLWKAMAAVVDYLESRDSQPAPAEGGRVIIVGLHNKAGLAPLDSSTASGKRVDELISLLDRPVIKTNLFDCDYLPIDYLEKEEHRALWIDKVNPRPFDIVVLLGKEVQKEFPQVACRVIHAPHPSPLNRTGFNAEKIADEVKAAAPVSQPAPQEWQKVFTKNDARQLLEGFQDYCTAHEIDPPYSFSTLVDYWINDYITQKYPQPAEGEAAPQDWMRRFSEHWVKPLSMDVSLAVNWISREAIAPLQSQLPEAQAENETRKSIIETYEDTCQTWQKVYDKQAAQLQQAEACIKELEMDYGLLKIHCEHTTNHLKQANDYIENREAEIKTLQQQLKEAKG